MPFLGLIHSISAASALESLHASALSAVVELGQLPALNSLSGHSFEVEKDYARPPLALGNWRSPVLRSRSDRSFIRTSRTLRIPSALSRKDPTVFVQGRRKEHRNAEGER